MAKFSRRKNFRRFRPKRVTRRVRKQVMRQAHRDGRSVFKLRYTYTMASTAGGIIQDSIGLTDPTNALAGASVLDWSNISGLYDIFKVNAVKFKFIPAWPNNNSPTPLYAPIYSVVDMDTPNISAAVTSVNQAIEYENMKVHNFYRPFSRYVKVRKYTFADLPSGYNDIQTPINNGQICLYASGCTPSVTYGQMILTYYVSCKTRR